MNFNYVVLKVSLYGSILSQKKELEEKIDDIVYKYAGVRGIRYNRIPMSFNEHNAIEMREQMMNELKSPQKELEYAERMINIMKPDVDEILSKFDKTTRMSYSIGKNIRNAHPLKTEIYKRGYTIQDFANECGISRFTLNRIFKDLKPRGDTINLISKELGISYERIEKICSKNY